MLNLLYFTLLYFLSIQMDHKLNEDTDPLIPLSIHKIKYIKRKRFSIFPLYSLNWTYIERESRGLWSFHNWIMIVILSKLLLTIVGGKILIGPFQYLYWVRGPAHGKIPLRPWKNPPQMDIAEVKEVIDPRWRDSRSFHRARKARK